MAIKAICTACSCLCDDLELELENNKITKIENACVKGTSFILASEEEERRASCMVEGHRVDCEEAISKATQVLSQARHPLIFGLDHSTLEAQEVAIALARKLKGTIDDNSSFCQGRLVEHILAGDLPSCTLSEASNADLFIYWGANPHHSHPRHLSKFTLYVHPEYREIGTSRKVSMAIIEVRESESVTSAHHLFTLLPKDDRNFIASIIEAIEGKETRKDAREFLDLLRKSSASIIFVGLGLTYSLDNDFSLFIEMIKKLDRRVSVIPMIGHSNMRGFNHSLYKATGYVNKVSFADGVCHGSKYSLLEQIKERSFDCLLVIGANPFYSIPQSMLGYLQEIPVITVDPYYTDTAKASKVVIASAISGLEVGGTVVRMDGVEVSLNAVKDTDKLSDEQILKKILEGVSR